MTELRVTGEEMGAAAAAGTEAEVGPPRGISRETISAMVDDEAEVDDEEAEGICCCACARCSSSTLRCREPGRFASLAAASAPTRPAADTPAAAADAADFTCACTALSTL